MICFLRASTIQYDVRLQKYIQACEAHGMPYIALTWDRLNDCSKVYENEIQYKRLTPYARRWRNAASKILWQFYLLRNLIRYHKRYKVIHACNSETVLPAIAMKIFGKKVILDVYDAAFIGLEKKCARGWTDIYILPTKKRLELIDSTEEQVNNFLEVENVPSLKAPESNYKSDFSRSINISYVGIFEPKIRGIENLVNEVIANDKLTLNIAGASCGMEDFIRDAESRCSRIKYWGAVDYSTALQIMSNSDFISAMYYNTCPNHTYASPNKYYESLCLGVPIITTTGTLVGENAQKHCVGYPIGETQEDLHSFFEKVQLPEFQIEYQNCKANAKQLWNTKYKDYHQKVLHGKYIKAIRKLLKI